MSADYEVGYCKPPIPNQFKPGESGNPKGRTKGTRNLATDLEQVLNELVLVTEGNKKVEINKQQAMFKSLIAKALNGDVKAIQTVIKLKQSLEESKASMTITNLNDDGSAGQHEVDIEKVLDGLGVPK